MLHLFSTLSYLLIIIFLLYYQEWGLQFMIEDIANICEHNKYFYCFKIK